MILETERFTNKDTHWKLIDAIQTEHINYLENPSN